MKKYDFETVIPRYDIGAPKWLEIERYFPERPDRIIPFSVADAELRVAPEIREGLKKYIDTYSLGYAKATPTYQEAVCSWMKTRHNWEIKPEWIISNRGVINAFQECIQAYTDEGDGVIMFTPVYYPMYAGITNNKRVLAECPLINRGSRYEMDLELFEQLAKKPENKLLIFVNPHNPGGRVWTREELEKLGNICVENNVVIASDEIHFDYITPGVKHTVFATVSPEIADNCIVMTAPSKSFNLAGLEPANTVISNPVLREKYVAAIKKSFMDARCNSLGFEACRIAYTECAEWMDQAVALIDTNRRLVVEFMRREFPEIVCMDLEGSYMLWMDFSGLGIECHELAQRLRKEAKLFFDDGYIFGKAGEGYERWNLACPTSYIEEALLRLKQAFGR